MRVCKRSGYNRKYRTWLYNNLIQKTWQPINKLGKWPVHWNPWNIKLSKRRTGQYTFKTSSETDTTLFLHWNTQDQSIPDGLVVKNLPANAEDTGSIPGPGWIQATKSIVLQLQSPPTLEPLLHNKRSHCIEKPELHN